MIIHIFCFLVVCLITLQAAYAQANEAHAKSTSDWTTFDDTHPSLAGRGAEIWEEANEKVKSFGRLPEGFSYEKLVPEVFNELVKLRLGKNRAESNSQSEISLAQVIAWGNTLESILDSRILNTYRSEHNRFEVLIPSSWERIPQDTIDRLNQDVSGSEVGIVFEAGFQPKSATYWLQCPYMLIQPITFSDYGIDRAIQDDDLDEIINAFARHNTRKVVATSTANDFNLSIDSLKFDEVRVDRAARKYWYVTEIPNKKFETMRALVVGHIGKTSIIQLMLYDLPSSREVEAPVQIAMIKSFKFDASKIIPSQFISEQGSSAAPQTYSPRSPTKSSNGESNFDRVLTQGAIGGVMGVITIVVIIVVYLFNRPRSSDIDR